MIKNRLQFHITPEEFQRDFPIAYKCFLSFERLEDWAEAENISLQHLKKVYPLKDFAKYYIHQYKEETGILPRVVDLPKVVLQAFNSRSYDLFRAAGFRDPKPIHYQSAPIDMYDVPPFKEADVFGVTINHFTQYPEGCFIDIPFLPPITAHYFNPNTMTYVFYTKPEEDFLYEEKIFCKELYKGIFNIEIIELEEGE